MGQHKDPAAYRKIGTFGEMKYLRNQDGFIKPILWIGILALLIYSGIQFGMPHYRHAAFKNDVVDIARVGLGNVDRIKAQVFESAQGHNIPLKEKAISVKLFGDSRIHVTASWKEQVDLLGLYQHTFYFDIDVKE